MVKKSQKAYRTITEASKILALKPHVLRFWETKFDALQPMTRGGGRRYYSPEDIELLKTIKHLLYGEGLTIKAASEIIDKTSGTPALNNSADQATDNNASPSIDRAGDMTTDTLPLTAPISVLESLDAKLIAHEARAMADIARLDSMLENLSAVGA